MMGLRNVVDLETAAAAFSHSVFINRIITPLTQLIQESIIPSRIRPRWQKSSSNGNCKHILINSNQIVRDQRVCVSNARNFNKIGIILIPPPYRYTPSPSLKLAIGKGIKCRRPPPHRVVNTSRKKVLQSILITTAAAFPGPFSWVLLFAILNALIVCGEEGHVPLPPHPQNCPPIQSIRLV